MGIELNRYYINMICDLKHSTTCPLCFEHVDKHESCTDHFRLRTFMSDVRICIKYKYFIDFVCIYYQGFTAIQLEARQNQYSSKKPLKIKLLDLIDEEYDFLRLVQTLIPKLDKLITFI